MSVQIRESITRDGVLPIEALRATLLAPTVARALHEERLPYYSQPVGGTFGLNVEGLVCALCGIGFRAPSFAIASVKTGEIWREDKRVGDKPLVMHRKCVRVAEDTGLCLDDYFAQMENDAAALAAAIERGES